MGEQSAVAPSELAPACVERREQAAATTGQHFAHPHADILGVRVSAVNLEIAIKLASQWVEASRPGYACFAGVHGVMEAQRDSTLRLVLNRAAFNFPDGMPMTWLGRLQGFRGMDRVFGPDFMMAMCRFSVERGYRNFLYGGNPGVAEQLSGNLQLLFPGLKIVGTFTPPFRPLTLEEEADLFARITEARPHILWVGLSTPKQDRFMAQYVDRLQVPLLAGVGAAFDFHTGTLRDCSHWVKRAGLQWLHRLLQEPKRLWKRYLLNNPAFIWCIARQMLSRRDRNARSSSST
jgi:N-acetylglucosaminyldiphosphoundecaprenol N-acetyl-beta-D-mannosaminyltransferase